MENCGNTLILRCSASKQGGTSEYASRLIGDREVLRTDVSASRGYNHRAERHTSQGESLRHVTERAVMPSEIEQLPDLAGYLKLVSSPSWMRVQFPAPKRSGAVRA